MESLRLIPLHHGFYDGVGRGLHQQTLVPVGVQRVAQLLGATMVRRTGAGPAANRGGHCLNPLQGGKGGMDRSGDGRKKMEKRQQGLEQFISEKPRKKMSLSVSFGGSYVVFLKNAN